MTRTAIVFAPVVLASGACIEPLDVNFDACAPAFIVELRARTEDWPTGTIDVVADVDGGRFEAPCETGARLACTEVGWVQGDTLGYSVGFFWDDRPSIGGYETIRFSVTGPEGPEHVAVTLEVDGEPIFEQSFSPSYPIDDEGCPGEDWESAIVLP